MRIVLDTNVLVSGLISAGGPPGRIVDLIRSGTVRLAVDDRILAEYADVLRRDSMRRYYPPADAENVLEFLRHDSDHVVCGVIVQTLPDPGDIPLLETALAAGVPLVTGNLRHFPAAARHGVEVLAPAEFLVRM